MLLCVFFKINVCVVSVQTRKGYNIYFRNFTLNATVSLPAGGAPISFCASMLRCKIESSSVRIFQIPVNFLHHVVGMVFSQVSVSYIIIF